MALVLLATCSPNSMHVRLNVIRHVVVDDHIYVINVQATSGYVRCNKHLYVVGFKVW